VGIALALPAAALGSFAGADGVIAYTAHTPVQGEAGHYAQESSIWAVDPATGAQLQLTSGHDDTVPSFSPSGRMLAFQRDESGAARVYVAQADGAQARALVAGAEPAFSPDGQSLVFVRPDGLFVVGLAPGSPVTQITDHPGDREPRWGATGSIAFERTDEWHTAVPATNARASGELHVVNELALVTPPSLRVHEVMSYSMNSNMWPDWAPSGSTLAVALCVDHAGETFSDAALPKRLEGRPPLLPAVIFHTSCAPVVWAPDGNGFAEPEAGALAGRVLSSCPSTSAIEESEAISWQPLTPGTQALPTLACTPLPLPPLVEGESRGAVKAISLSIGSKSCIYSARRHRWRCFPA
jgi:dipeptidyl aminopeptidase/acylaminoacyl peptidase